MTPDTLTIAGGHDSTARRLDLTIRDGLLAEEQPADATFDATGLTIAPGFIDVQVNGAFGFDFTTDPESMWEAATRLPETGVTGFLPTVITAPEGTIQTAQEAMRHRPEGFAGAVPIGLHIEGPMISLAKRGAHPPEYLADHASAHDWSPENGVALVTVAPELPGAIEAIRSLVGRGVVVSLGHSDASCSQAQAGANAGATFGTHLFNAMSLMSSREPGLAGFLLTDPRMRFGLINDGVHLHRRLVELIWAAAGDRMVLITDAIAATGVGDGVYKLGSLEITVDGMTATRADGGLGGSVLTMDTAVRNLLTITGCTLGRAIDAATAQPAALMGLSDRGNLHQGNRADLVLLDRDVNVIATLVEGRIVYNTQPERLRRDPHKLA
jgi:N-acetylglucosamine-6-phosphate deacetylase